MQIKPRCVLVPKMQSAYPILGSFILRFSLWFMGPLLYVHALPNRDDHTPAGHLRHMGFVHFFLRLFHRRGCDSHQWYDLRTRGNLSTFLVYWRCILVQPTHEMVRFQFASKRSICSNLKDQALKYQCQPTYYECESFDA